MNCLYSPGLLLSAFCIQSGQRRALMCGNAAFMPVREDVVDKYGTDFAATADKNVYAGPFVISSTDNGEQHACHAARRRLRWQVLR